MSKRKWSNRMPDFGVDAVVVEGYTAQRDGSFLAYLNKLSERRWSRRIYGDITIYVALRTTNLISEYAIQGVLDRVPAVFPLELPELVEGIIGIAATKEQVEAIHEINEGLLYPIDGPDIVEIIKLAREYAKPREGEMN